MKEEEILQEQPGCVLVVDDDPCICRINASMLDRSGYQVDIAEDGAAGWQAIQSKHYDLLITDNSMPNVTGIELLRKIHDAGLALPAIMATGTFPDREYALFPWLQPAATLLKPYTVEEFLGVVKEVLSHSTLLQPVH